MFCRHCGAQISDTAKFCPSCGGSVTPKVQPAPESQPAPSAQQQGAYQQPASQQEVVQRVAVASQPKPYIDSERSTLTWLLLTIITCGIYDYYFTYLMARDVNTMCVGDGEETPGLLVFILLSIVTCGFYSYYWYYKIGNRLQANAPRYDLAFQEGGTAVLAWRVFGLLICCLGPIVAMNILIKNMNAMAQRYNAC